MQLNQDTVKASSGNGLGALDLVLASWARRKEIDYRYQQDNMLMDKQHQFNLERDNNRAHQQMLVNGTSAVFQSHFDNLLEANKHGNSMERIGEQGNQTRLNTKESGHQARLTAGYKFKKDSALKEQVHGQNTEMERLKAGNEIGRMSDEALYKQQNEDQQSGNRIKLEREKGKTARKNEKHRVQTGIQGMRDLTSGLAENYDNPSTGISPLVANSGSLQNIGNSLREHPFLKANPNAGGGSAASGAPLAPQTGGPGDPDSAGNATVTPPKVKKTRTPRVKKVSTGGGLTEVRNSNIETGTRGGA
jgi:hypothetical protein